MTLPRSVADVLSDHVVFELESIDRLYLLSELLCRSFLFTSRAVMRADMFAVHDRTGRAAGPYCLDRSAGGLSPADRRSVGAVPADWSGRRRGRAGRGVSAELQACGRPENTLRSYAI